MSEMIDRVIAAMRATELDCQTWSQEIMIELARAAIEAMREPTPEIKAISWCGDFADNLWRNMIDEVLK